MSRVPLASFTVHVYGPEKENGDYTDEALRAYEGYRVPRKVRLDLEAYLSGDSGLRAEVVMDDDWVCRDCGGAHDGKKCGR